MEYIYKKVLAKMEWFKLKTPTEPKLLQVSIKHFINTETNSGLQSNFKQCELQHLLSAKIEFHAVKNWYQSLWHPCNYIF